MATCVNNINDLFAADCPFGLKVMAKLFFQPIKDSQGNKNGFDSVADFNLANINTALADSDQFARFYPADDTVENVEDVRGDSITQEFSSGNVAYISQGGRTITVFYPYANPQLADQYKSLQSLNVGFTYADIDGNYVYQTDAATHKKVYPINILKGSLNPTVIPATDTTVPGVQIQFTVPKTFDDSLTRVIPRDIHGIDLFNDIAARKQVFAPTSTAIATKTTIELTTVYDAPVTGLLIGNFALYNNTTTAAVTIDSVTEISDGVYELAHASGVTAGNVLAPTVTFSPATTYNFDRVNADTVTVA